MFSIKRILAAAVVVAAIAFAAHAAFAPAATPSDPGFSFALLSLTSLIRRSKDYILPDGTAVQEWTYTTNDDAAALAGAGYFNGAVDILPKGSVIHAIIDCDGTIDTRFILVTANNGTAVTVSVKAWA